MSSINEKLTRIDNNISNLKNTLGLEATDPIENIKIPSINDCSYMFYEGSKLDEFDTICKLISKASNMSYMFSLTTFTNDNIVDFSKLNTSNVINMYEMFSGVKGISKIDLSSFDTSKVTNTNKMFYNCKVSEIDFSSFDVSSIDTLTFNGCYASTVYVKNEEVQQKILDSNYTPSGWTTANVIVKK